MFRFAALSLCVLSLLGVLSAQTGNGTITGVVTDPTGAVVANAPIEVRNTGTGVVFRAVSTDTGNYTVPQVPIGSYELTTTVQGFKRYDRQNITLAAAQVLRLDIPLEIGASTEAVTVSAESTLLKTESGDLTHNITLDQMQNLPLLGVGNANSGSSGIRNPYNVAQTIPGVSYSANSVMVVNGAPNNTASYRLEGMDNTNHTVGFAVQENQPSADSVQEVAIQTSNYAAEFGAAGGGLFNIVMKSGTNAYHGTGYEYFVNEDLNASRAFSSSTGAGGKFQDRNRRNDYGGTLGGPIYIPKVYDGHNRSFFFFGYEQFRESSLLNPGQTLPIDAYRKGDFSSISVNGGSNFNTGLGVTTTALPSKDGLGRDIFANTIYDPATRTTNPANNVAYANAFPGNIIPSTRFDPTAVKIQALIPATQNNAYTNNANYTNISSRYTPIPSLKLDHSIGSKGKLSYYWSTTGTESLYSLPNGNADGLPPTITQARGTFIYSQTERLNYDHSLTPTILLHVGGGYSHISFYDGGPVRDFNCQDISLKGCQASIFFPRVIIGTTGSIGGMQSFGNAQAHTLTNTERPAFNANATWIKGSHTFKLGGEVWFQGQIQAPPSGTTLTFGTTPLGSTNTTSAATALPFNPPQGLGSSVIGNPYASFLLGDVQSAAQNAPRDTRMGQSQWGLYLQDSWKVNRKLTLDLGLRWDYGRAAREQYGRSANFSGTLANPNAGGHPGAYIYGATCNCDFVSNYMYAIGPRIGLAYQITPKTVLRAGWGFAYAPVPDIGISTANALTNSPAGPNAFFNIQDPATMPQPVWPNFDPGIYPLIVNGAGTTNNSLQALDRNAARPPRQNQWSIGIQREVTRNLVVEASYVANRGVWWSGPLGLLNQVSPDTFAALGLHPYTNATDNASAELDDRVHCCDVQARQPAALHGLSDQQHLAQHLENVSAVLRRNRWLWRYPLAHGKDLVRFLAGQRQPSAFRMGSRSPANSPGPRLWSIRPSPRISLTPTAPSKQLQTTDQPFLFNIAAVYTTPKAQFLDKWKAASWIAKDWQIGVSATYGSGTLLTPPNQTTTNNLGSSQMVRVAGEPLYLKDPNCHCINPWTDQILNPKAWTNVTATGAPDYTTNNSGGSLTGVFGHSGLYSDFRGPRRPIENFNFGRNFRIKERMNFQIRAEFTNALNRVFLGNPNSTTSPRLAVGKNQAGQITSGFGTINATFAPNGFATLAGNPSLPRQGTIVARFTF